MSAFTYAPVKTSTPAKDVPRAVETQGRHLAEMPAFDHFESAHFSFGKIAIQPKLKISQPGDMYEQEAERVAEQVMAMPAYPAANRSQLHIQRFAGQSNGQLDSAPASSDHALARHGIPLEQALRQEMEQRFGYDFSGVRVHSDADAERSARDVNADAYTVGQDVVFGAGQFAPDTPKGRLLLAHELTHVVQQSEGSSRPPQVPRGVPGSVLARSPSKPEWAMTSSEESLPGVPVRGYEQPKASYTEQDRDALEEALRSRFAENEGNVTKFLGDYGSALIDLWGRYATETMAKAAEESGWPLWGKLLKFVIKESLLIVSGIGLAAKLGHLGVEFVKVAIAAIAEVGTTAAESAGKSSKVQMSRSEIDQKTKEVADTFKNMPADFIKRFSSPVAAVDYTSWLKTAPLYDLGKFRIPPAFPPMPTRVVRAAVAQVIVGLLHGSPSVNATMPGGYGPAKNVIIVNLEPAPYGLVTATFGPHLWGSEILTQELYGFPIKELPKIPLHVTLVSRDSPVAAVRTALAESQISLRETFRPSQNIFGGDIPGEYDRIDPVDAFLEAYPEKSPIEITRDDSGYIGTSGGGFLEHLYLYRLAKPGKDIGSVLYEIEKQRLSRMRERGVSEMLSGEELAKAVWSLMWPWVREGAEALIHQRVESMMVMKPISQESVCSRCGREH